jgi:hypothetical protein
MFHQSKCVQTYVSETSPRSPQVFQQDLHIHNDPLSKHPKRCAAAEILFRLRADSHGASPQSPTDSHNLPMENRHIMTHSKIKNLENQGGKKHFAEQKQLVQTSQYVHIDL